MNNWKLTYWNRTSYNQRTTNKNKNKNFHDSLKNHNISKVKYWKKIKITLDHYGVDVIISRFK